MPVLKSLTAKYAFLSLISILLISAFVIVSFNFAHHMPGEAAKINQTGQLRYRSFKMAWYAHKIAENQSRQRTILAAELSREIQEYDKCIDDLIKGNPNQEINSIRYYRESMPLFDNVVQEWQRDLRPVLLKTAGLSQDLSERQARESLMDFDEKISGFVLKIDRLVTSLQRHTEKELSEFERARIVILGSFILGAIFIVWYLRRNIIDPVRTLTQASLKVKQGNFGVVVPVQGNDEIAVLGSAFNEMSQGLAAFFIEKTNRLRELDVLNVIGRASSESLTVDVMAGKIMDAILSLEPLALENQGAIFITDKDKKILKLVVSRNFSDAQVIECGAVPYGECLCGIAAEQDQVILSNSNIRDARHTKSYAGGKEHGHIILPLKSHDKQIGILCLYLPQEMKLSNEDHRLYESIADIIAVALQNAINHREVAMLAQSLDSSADSVVITDTAGVILHVNHAFIKQTGASLQELVGKHLSIIGANIQPELAREIFRKTMEGGWTGEMDAQRKDGSIYPVQVTSAPVRDENGRIVGTVNIARDITERNRTAKAIETLYRQNKIILDAAGEGIFGIDLEGRTTFLNPAVTDMLGFEPEELLGTVQHFLIHHSKSDGSLYPREECPIYSAFKNGKVYHVDNEVFWKKNGASFPVEYTSTPVWEDGKVAGAVVVFKDITERKRVGEELKASEERLKTIFNEVPLGIALIDSLTGHIYEVNRMFAKIAGRTLEQMANIDWMSITHPDDVQKDLDNMALLNAGKIQGFQMEKRYLHLDGTVVWINMTIAQLEIEDKDQPRHLCMIEDITERKQAEETINRYNEELLSLADASNVVLTTATTTKLYEKICEIAVRNFSLKMAWLGLVIKDSYEVKLAGQFGFDEGYLKNINISWDDSPTGMGPTGMAIKTKSTHVVDDIRTDSRFALWREKAVVREFRSSLAAPMITREGDVIGTINLYSEEARFFTPQRKKLFQVFANQAATAIENAMLVEDLEQKVSIRTREFETANRQLLTVNEELALRRSEAETAKIQADAANRAKSDFLANMSHELRTPLNAIIGFSDIMINGMTGPMTDEQLDFTRDIGKSGKHLLNLINDILDLSKVEAGKMELEPGTLNVKELIEKSLMMFKEKAMRHRINVDQRVEDGITDIIADEMKLKQVLVNLLSNAFKYTPDGGSIALRAWSEAGGEIGFSVQDTGPGIRAEDIPKLFQPFQQIDVTLTRKVSGTGLGLNLCRKFVEMHRGKIWVETEVGKGSKFLFVIPVR